MCGASAGTARRASALRGLSERRRGAGARLTLKYVSGYTAYTGDLVIAISSGDASSRVVVLRQRGDVSEETHGEAARRPCVLRTRAPVLHVGQRHLQALRLQALPGGHRQRDDDLLTAA